MLKKVRSKTPFSLQRWISRDPIAEAGGINLYSYVLNNPISRIDPVGLWGAGVVGSGVVEGGLASPVAAGATGSVGGGVFNNSFLGFMANLISPEMAPFIPGNTAGAFASGGAFAGTKSAVPCPNGYKTPPFAFGGTGGVGGGGFITNARTVSDLGGPFDTGSLNLPFIGLQVSWGHADDGAFIWSLSAEMGKSAGASVSSYPTTTATHSFGK